jgi:putative oxidoreductase
MQFLDSYEPQIKAVLRIVVGLLFLHIGIAKLFHFPAVHNWMDITVGVWPEGYAAPIELVTGALVLLGFYSRIAAFIASGEMAFAYFIGHAPKSIFPALNGGAEAILFCFAFLYLAAGGPGAWAVNRK